MKHKATYLLIKSSVLSVTDQQQPEKKYPLCREKMHPDAIEECDLGSKVAGKCVCYNYDQAMKAFNDSFIKVDNPEVAIRAITAPIQNKVTGLYDDGLYPVDGIEFEVNAPCCKMNPTGCDDCINFNPLAVVSLIGDKEEKKLPTLHEHNEKKRELYDKPVDNNAGVACEKCGKEMQYKDQNLVTLSNPPMTQVICECGNSGYKVL